MAERPTFDEVLKKRDGYTDEETAEARRDILDRIMEGEDGFDVIEENVRSNWNPEEEDLAQVPALVEALLSEKKE